MALVTQAVYDRLYARHDRSLSDTGRATFRTDSWAVPSGPFGCALISPGKQAGGNRLDFESGAHDGFRLHVATTAPALRDGDRVTVTRVVLGRTLTVKVQVVDDAPAVTHQRHVSYAVRELT